MSKLNMDGLRKAITDILAASKGETVQAETTLAIKGKQPDGYKGKKRKFVETVELQVGLKDYDTQRDKRFSGVVQLPHVPRRQRRTLRVLDGGKQRTN